eukprot:CAMPEP_0197644784 /NCGR_PEP_ID=MMETSP1338-20131121/17648_1 /TAXON_ID=43686 ORGANISM="Pelagodinium beii, Strain RCC1491" /NCGR_SAMPLE_ID=MMETSP1338 /ASSEMBLY_ACC=CAM_ASM_000754 /LENGTH=781 /DNA_ID=CAMNT_0043218243 /DNA_START=79 /DNA_END=2424 /DNA_ORIENTATION=-
MGPKNAKEEDQGMLPRLLHDLFDKISEHGQSGSAMSATVEMYEVYNEKVRDLISQDLHEKKLDVHVHPQHGIYVENATHQSVSSAEETLSILEMGRSRGTVAATQMNPASSRAHTIFKMAIEKHGNDNSVVSSEIYFVDLAGRENEKTTKVTGQQFVELTFINKSLMFLAQCIQALGKDAKKEKKEAKAAESSPESSPANKASPSKGGGQNMGRFRNSKLTLLLSNALTGNSRTALVATLSPAAMNMEENYSTLNFAYTVKSIKVKAVASKKINKAVLVTGLEEEIKELKLQLQEALAHQAPNAPELEQGVKVAEGFRDNYQQRWEEASRQNIVLKWKIGANTALQKSLKDKEAKAEALRRQAEELEQHAMETEAEAKRRAEAAERALEEKRKALEDREQALAAAEIAQEQSLRARALALEQREEEASKSASYASASPPRVDALRATPGNDSKSPTPVGGNMSRDMSVRSYGTTTANNYPEPSYNNESSYSLPPAPKDEMNGSSFMNGSREDTPSKSPQKSVNLPGQSDYWLVQQPRNQQGQQVPLPCLALYSTDATFSGRLVFSPTRQGVEYSIGYADTCDFKLPPDQGICPVACHIVQSKGSFWMRPDAVVLMPSASMSVNQQRIVRPEPMELHHQDFVTIGPFKFYVFTKPDDAVHSLLYAEEERIQLRKSLQAIEALARKTLMTGPGITSPRQPAAQEARSPRSSIACLSSHGAASPLASTRTTPCTMPNTPSLAMRANQNLHAVQPVGYAPAGNRISVPAVPAVQGLARNGQWNGY